MTKMSTAMNEFHKHYEKSRIWENNTWFGIPMWKLPFDAFVIQELIVDIRPEYIIETGTGHGGSAMFYASICELLGEGRVITIDIEDKVDMSKVKEYEWSDRITFLHGGSTNPLLIEEIYKSTRWEDIDNFYYGNGGLVLLDSWHTKVHVLKEMEIYHKFVHEDSYMIIEDSHVNGNPVPWEYNDDGPMGAINDWLDHHDDWESDYECEKHLMTFNPKGYLKRKGGN